MVNLSVDEAYAFDYLAILYTKMMYVPSEQNNRNFDECVASLYNQIGTTQVNQILISPEYSKLTLANAKLFVAIENLRKDESNAMTARELDGLNTERWLAKRELQAKFFATQQTETKTV